MIKHQRGRIDVNGPIMFLIIGIVVLFSFLVFAVIVDMRSDKTAVEANKERCFNGKKIVMLGKSYLFDLDLEGKPIPCIPKQ